MLRKKWIAIILTVLMACAFLPAFAFAEVAGDGGYASSQTIGQQNEGEGEQPGEGEQQNEGEGEQPGEGEGGQQGEGEQPSSDQPVSSSDKATTAATTHAKTETKKEAKAQPAVATVDQPSYELTVVGEEQVPLAGNLLDGRCCVLHLFIIFIAGILLLYYIRDMRKHQARIFELEEELEGFFEE